MVTVVGHTHWPVFISQDVPGQVEHLLAQARSQMEAEPDSKKAQEQVADFEEDLDWATRH